MYVCVRAYKVVCVGAYKDVCVRAYKDVCVRAYKNVRNLRGIRSYKNLVSRNKKRKTIVDY